MELGVVIGLLLLSPLLFLRSLSATRRYAVFLFGEFKGLKGPGILLRNPLSETKWVPIGIGNQGELIAPGLGRFGHLDLPILTEEEVEPGAPIRIVQFSTDQIVVRLDPSRLRRIECPNCGHTFDSTTQFRT